MRYSSEHRGRPRHHTTQMTATAPRKSIASLSSPDGHKKVVFFNGLMASPKTAEGPHISYVCFASSANRPGQFNNMGTFADCVGNVRNMWRDLIKSGWQPC